MSDAESGLTRVTMNLTRRAVSALTRLREDGSTQTDAVNRAVQVNAALLPYLDPETGRLTVLTADGETVHIHLVG